MGKVKRWTATILVALVAGDFIALVATMFALFFNLHEVRLPLTFLFVTTIGSLIHLTIVPFTAVVSGVAVWRWTSTDKPRWPTPRIWAATIFGVLFVLMAETYITNGIYFFLFFYYPTSPGTNPGLVLQVFAFSQPILAIVPAIAIWRWMDRKPDAPV